MSTQSASTTSIIVHGASGRMGQRIVALALEDPSLALVGAVVRASSPRAHGATLAGSARDIPTFAGDSPQFGAGACDCVIDFSSDEGALIAARIAQRTRAALLVGTTALSLSTIDALKKLSTEVPVLVAPNTSLGVAVLASLVTAAAASLGMDYRCSIVEAHHSAKKDAPSGTAKRLAAAAKAGGALLPDDQVLAMRGGDVIGEHTVRFAGPGEYIELTHRATTRDLFARGALRAAKWLKGRPAGWYTIENTLEAPGSAE